MPAEVEEVDFCFAGYYFCTTLYILRKTNVSSRKHEVGYDCEVNDVRLTSSITQRRLCLQRRLTLCQVYFYLAVDGVTKLMYLLSHSQFLFWCIHKGDVIKTSHIIGK